MTAVAIDSATGALVAGGEKLFPIGLSNPPPRGSRTPGGRDGLEEVGVNGINFVRTGTGKGGKVLGEYRATGYLPSYLNDFIVMGLVKKGEPYL